MSIQQALQNVLTNPAYLAAWGVLVAISLGGNDELREDGYRDGA